MIKFFKNLLTSPAFWLGSSLLAAGVTTNLVARETVDEGDAKAIATVNDDKILREGTRIDSRSVECRASGDRLTLQVPDFGKPLTALENLSAQRVLQSVLDDPSDDKWVVTGVVTEFQGRNFLLIERVVRETRQ